MKAELGKWLMDVAKYILTAVLISTMFKEMDDIWLTCSVGAVLVLCLLAIGLNLQEQTPQKKKSKKK